MARRVDNAPVGNTCPKIDEVLSILTAIYQSSEEMSKGELKSVEDLMEKIRSDNAALREWGNDQCNQLEEMEKDRDYYQDKTGELENEVKDLQSEVRELEKQLSEV